MALLTSFIEAALNSPLDQRAYERQEAQQTADLSPCALSESERSDSEEQTRRDAAQADEEAAKGTAGQGDRGFDTADEMVNFLLNGTNE